MRLIVVDFPFSSNAVRVFLMIGVLQRLTGLYTKDIDKDSPAHASEFYDIIESKLNDDSVSLAVFRRTYEQAKEEAKRTESLLVVYFHSPWNPESQLFLDQTLTQDSVWRFLNNPKIVFYVADVSLSFSFSCTFCLKLGLFYLGSGYEA